MTRDDIIRIAEESGLARILGDWLHEFTLDTWPKAEIPELERFAALVAAAEREACAKVCFEMAQRHNDIRSAALEMASEYIRARGEP